MFYVTSGLRFKFAHVRGKEKEQFKAKTVCTIDRKLVDGYDWFRVSRGIAECSKEDSFSRAIGRKIALTRAIKRGSSIDKETRTKIWETYFSKVNDLKRK